MTQQHRTPTPDAPLTEDEIAYQVYTDSAYTDRGWITFKPRRSTQREWVKANPVLRRYEIGVEVDTGFAKVGDGVTPYASLPHAPTPERAAYLSDLADLGRAVIHACPMWRDVYVNEGVRIVDLGEISVDRDLWFSAVNAEIAHEAAAQGGVPRE